MFMTDDRPPQPPPEAPSPLAGADPASADPGPASADPAGSAPTPPPPLTAFAWRNGLVRPKQGRLLAGVSGAFGRATNTDPVLWRVVFAVLAFFAGIGVLAYLIAWLLLPADGDTASPIEALAGRGRSGTSTVLTIIGGAIVVFSFAAYFSEPFRAAPLLAVALLGGALLLLLRDQRGRVRTAGAAPTAQMWSTSAGPVVGTGPPGSGAAPGSAVAPGTVGSGESGAPVPPFAPYGPFPPPVATTTYPGLPPQPPMPPPAPPFVGGPPPRPPARPRPPRSRLGLLTISLVLVVVGAVALVDLAGNWVPAAGYVAAALATVGLGLLIGAWIGRARWLIAVGIVLSIALASVFGAQQFQGTRGGTVTWAPPSIDQLRDEYRHDVGDATLDLTAIDFADTQRSVDITVKVDLGNLEIIVPPDVDVTVDANVDVGNADIFRENWGGLGPGSRTVTDFGEDGPGGGQLRIDAGVGLGNLEVHR